MADTPNYTWFITGANRGIGLELTKQLLESPANTVLAACRNPPEADALNALAGKGRVHVLPLEITDRESVRDAVRAVGEIVGERGLDYLVNNAAINVEEWDAPSTLQPEVMQAVFDTNVVAPAYITQAFLPLVEKSKKKTVVNVSSTLGSLGADGFGTRSTSYAISKAALNMVTYKQQKERPDIVFISMCPGWLRTDMGGEDAPNDVATGVAGVLKTIEGLTLADSGKFFNFKGEIVPW
ncbi:NAD-P-binding protein [Trametes versicolor FP-101664 SS1]|uniref:NAD-P-binding protein n=1 Tax=Trametes versicolor (strain FP-101664) TaxID=717944 RepID=UPI00046215D5|nr:NAD-P-binding protein [Trametes versicolor FP-101664 SS1]EIW54621.1 NAD-P-binding protein [Trametes versicolor FP-101664 SS1]